MKNQRGFTLLEGLIILIVILAVGLGGYFVYSKVASNKDSETVNSTSGMDEGTNTQVDEQRLTYEDPTGDFSFKYPESWSLETTDQFEIKEDPKVMGVVFGTHTLTAPSGAQIRILHNYGGRGGSCDPNDADKPHSQGNRCSTWEPIYLEELEDSKGFFLSRIKYSNEDGTVFYSGIENRLSTLNDPQMGLWIGHSSVDIRNGYLDIITPKGTSSDYFETSEAKEVESILKSMKLVKRLTEARRDSNTVVY